MAIEGKKRENKSFDLYVGLFEGKVVAINPTPEEYEELTGIAPKEDSKTFEYLGESRNGNTYLRLEVWLQDIVERETDTGMAKELFKVSFYLEDRVKMSKDELRTQYINNAGKLVWADDETKLDEWFKKKQFRKAKIGEDELYGFLALWLGGLDFSSEKAIISLDWKRLMRGNVKELREQMGGEFEKNIVALAAVHTEDVNGEPRAYQRVYSSGFCPANSIKFFKLLDYEDPDVITRIKEKKPLQRKPHERFVIKVTNPEYGCKDFYRLKELKKYDPSENIVATADVIQSDDPAF